MLDVDRIERSFALIREQEAAFVAQFYSSLFSKYPQVKPLFEHAQMQEQGKKLFKSLDLVVASLRQPKALDTLKSLGVRHIGYGVLPEHYPMVGDVLLGTLADLLGTDWTPAVRNAWAEAYQAVTQIMLSEAA